MRWTETNLSKVLEDYQNGTWGLPPKEDGYDLPVLRSTNIQNATLVLDDVAFRSVPQKSAKRYKLLDGDILVTTSSGSRDLIGKNALFHQPGDGQSYLFSNFTLRLRPRRDVINPRYLHLYLNSTEAKAELLRLQNTTSGLRNLPIPLYLSQTVPLPPISEQRRIVEILDQADALRKKRAQSDAKAARILPALFHRVFGDPLALVSSGEGVPLSELEVDMQNGFACGEKDVEDGVPHLRMNNIDDAGVLNLELVRTVPLDRDTQRYRLMERDVLFMGTNSEDKIGKTCLFLPPDERTYLFSNHLIRLRVSDSRITPEYLVGFLHLLWSKRFFPSIAKRWVNQSAVAQSSLAALRIPLPGGRSLQMFTIAFQNLLSLRAQRVRSGVTLDQTFAVLLHRAFTGDLTAKWREAHMKELLAEMEARAKALELNGAKT